MFDKEKHHLTPYPELKKIIEVYSRVSNLLNILYLGDSVLLRVSRDDADINTLDEMLSKKMGESFDVVSIAHTAYHMQVCKSLISVLTKTESKPDIVLLPINLRSFSPQWDYYPLWQFQMEIRAVNKYLSNPLDGIIGVGEIKITDTLLRLFDSIPVTYPSTNYTKVGQFRKLIASKTYNEEQRCFRLRQLFIYHYMYWLSDQHPKLIALEDCVKLLDGLNIPIIVYFTPINWQAGKKYVGNEFVETVGANINTIAKNLAGYLSNRVRLEDFSDFLVSDCFFTEDNATEHLNEKGRHLLSSELSLLVFEVLKDEEKRQNEN